MNNILTILDFIISLLGFFVIASSLYILNVLRTEPIAHIKSRLFNRFLEIKILTGMGLLSVIFFWMYATLELMGNRDLPLIIVLISRLCIISFEILSLSLFKIGAILKGNKKRRMHYYYSTLTKLKKRN